jgi:HlyD family secretion protein
MTRLIKLGIPAALLLSAGVLGWGFFNAREFLVQPKSLSEVAVPKAEIRQPQVVALGSIEPKNGVMNIAGPTGTNGGRIAKLSVQEGNTVNKGDVLAVLDTEPGLAASLKQAEADTASKEFAFTRAKLLAQKTRESQHANVDQLRADRDRAAVELETMANLVRRGIYQKAALRDKELALQSASEKLKSAEFELRYASERTENGEDFDVASARLALQSSRSVLAEAEADHAQSIILSPADGVVLSVDAEAGEQLDNSRLLRLADTTHMEVRAEVFEADIGLITSGQRASIMSRILTSPLHGTVRWIAPSVEKQSLLADDPAANTDNKVVTVRISLDTESVARSARLINHQVRVTFEDARVASLGSSDGAAR